MLPNPTNKTGTLLQAQQKKSWLSQKTDRLLGAHIIGPGAGEMINEVNTVKSFRSKHRIGIKKAILL